MKKSFTPLLLLAAVPLAAQPVFNAADLYPEIGTVVTSYLTDYVEPGPAGAGFTFDVGPLTLGNSSTTEVLLPSSTPYASSFPGATHSSATFSGDNYSYARVASDGVYNMGVKGSTQDIVMTNQEKIFAVPLSYQGTWTDTWSATVVNSGQTFTRTGSTTGNYNGHGTLILPFGTITNVARVTLSQTYGDVISGIAIDYEVVNTYYMKPGYDMVLFTSSVINMSMNGGPMNPISAYSIVIDPMLVGVEEFLDAPELAIFPNPANNSATVNIAPFDAASISLIDMLGREVRSIPAAAAGDRSVQLDLQGLARGSYLVRLVEQNGSAHTKQLVVE